MPRSPDITAIEKKGWEFEQKGFQERNVESLLKVLNKKEATEALTEIGKLNEETWRNVRSSVADLRAFVEMGGVSALITIFEGRVKDVVTLQLESALAPIKTSLTLVIDDFLSPAYDSIAAIATQLSGFVEENTYGTFIGALIGEAFGGDTGSFFGGIAGAAVEQGLKLLAIWWKDEWPKLITNIMTKIKDWWASLVPGGPGDAEGEWEWVFIGGQWMLRKKTPPDYDPGPGQTPEGYIEYREEHYF